MLDDIYSWQIESKKYFMRAIGIGTMTSATKPSNEDAHGAPNASYICVAKSWSCVRKFEVPTQNGRDMHRKYSPKNTTDHGVSCQGGGRHEQISI
jgi:hypothetical protein